MHAKCMLYVMSATHSVSRERERGREIYKSNIDLPTTKKVYDRYSKQPKRKDDLLQNHTSVYSTEDPNGVPGESK